MRRFLWYFSSGQQLRFLLCRGGKRKTEGWRGEGEKKRREKKKRKQKRNASLIFYIHVYKNIYYCYDIPSLVGIDFRETSRETKENEGRRRTGRESERQPLPTVVQYGIPPRQRDQISLLEFISVL